MPAKVGNNFGHASSASDFKVPLRKSLTSASHQCNSVLHVSAMTPTSGRIHSLGRLDGKEGRYGVLDVAMRPKAERRGSGLAESLQGEDARC